MKNKNKIKVWELICAELVFLIVLLIICIFIIQKRMDNLQMRLEQCAELEEENLNLCPMCGHNMKLNHINDSFYIECDSSLGEDGCGLSTGYYESKTELIEQWNNMYK